MADDDFDSTDDLTFEALARALPRVTPPAVLEQRILTAATATNAPGDAQVIPLRPARRFRTVGAATVAAIVAAAAAVALTLGLHSGGLGTPAQRSVLVAHGAASVQGTAALYHPDRPGGTVRVVLTHVPYAPAGHHYEVWVLRKGVQQMTAVGSFTPASHSLTLTLPLPAPGNYAALDISVQANDGPPQHSNTSLAGASFT